MRRIFLFMCLLFAAGCAKDSVGAGGDEAMQAVPLAQLIGDLAAGADFSGVVLVAEKGEPLFLEAFDPPGLNEGVPVSTGSGFAIASMTKSFTAVLVLQLVEEGRLSLDDTIVTHLPSYKADYAGRVTVRQMLQNRSGIPHYISIPGWFDNDFKRGLTQESLLETVSDLPLAFEPGSDYLYSNTNYYLLGLIIEAVTGKPYEAVLSERIIDPVGLSDTGQIYEPAPIPGLVNDYLREGDGTYHPVPVVNPILFRATASQYSTARGLLRWSDALMEDDLLSMQSKAAMLAPEAPMAWTVGSWPVEEGGTMPFYTYNGQLIGYTSMLTQFPEVGGTIILLNNNNAGYDRLSGMTVAIAARLYGGAEEE